MDKVVATLRNFTGSAAGKRRPAVDRSAVQEQDLDAAPRYSRRVRLTLLLVLALVVWLAFIGVGLLIWALVAG